MYFRITNGIKKGEKVLMAKNKKFSSFLENPIDYTLLITVLLLLTIGLIMVLSASSPTSLSESGNSYKYFVKQAIFAIIGLVLMTFISNIDYRFYKKFYKIAYIIAIILLASVLVIGKTINNKFTFFSTFRNSKVLYDNFLCRDTYKKQRRFKISF